MSDAREVLLAKDAVFEWARGEERADAILSALSAMPLASRLALARALVPGWVVVPGTASVSMVGAGVIAALAARKTKPEGMSELGSDLVSGYAAMLTAAEEPPHGP